MSHNTFSPGTRVRVFPGGTLGTVADLPKISAEFAGFTPVIFDGRTRAEPCSSDQMTVFVPKTALSPGARVSDRGNGRLGTVADDPAMAAEYPGMIPVHWDGGTRSVAAPSILEQVAL